MVTRAVMRRGEHLGHGRHSTRRSRVARVAVLLLCSLPGWPAAAPPAVSKPGSYETIDLMPLFWRFWERAEGAAVEQQAELFRDMVAGQRPEVYNAAVLGIRGGESLDAVLPHLYAKSFEWTSPQYGVMRTLSEDIARSLPHHAARFLEAFPDFRFAGRVYFMHSLGAFDGAVRQVEGRTALLFGLDVIATIYGPGAEIAPLFHHELFHLYHDQHAAASASERRLYEALWSEGLATFVARRLNPGASDKSVFGLPENTPARVLRDLPRVADLVRARLDSTSPDDYGRFFLGNAPDAEPPSRSGYYVGYLVASRLAKDRSLQDLARLDAGALRDAMASALGRPSDLVADEPGATPRR